MGHLDEYMSADQAAAHLADFQRDLTIAFCNGAPNGFEADCGRPGAHGPHEIGGDQAPAPAQHPTAAFLHALADDLTDGAPDMYVIEVNGGPTARLQLNSPADAGVRDILWWAGRLGAATVQIRHRYSKTGDRFSVHGTIGGRAVEIWDVINVSGHTHEWVENVPVDYLARPAEVQ